MLGHFQHGVVGHLPWPTAGCQLDASPRLLNELVHDPSDLLRDGTSCCRPNWRITQCTWYFSTKTSCTKHIRVYQYVWSRVHRLDRSRGARVYTLLGVYGVQMTRTSVN